MAAARRTSRGSAESSVKHGAWSEGPSLSSRQSVVPLPTHVNAIGFERLEPTTMPGNDSRLHVTRRGEADWNYAILQLRVAM